MIFHFSRKNTSAKVAIYPRYSVVYCIDIIIILVNQPLWSGARITVSPYITIVES